MQAATKANVWLYRRTSGRVGGRGMDKRPLLLLTAPGRRSGALRRPKIRSVSAGVCWCSGFHDHLRAILASAKAAD